MHKLQMMTLDMIFYRMIEQEYSVNLIGILFGSPPGKAQSTAELLLFNWLFVALNVCVSELALDARR